MKNTLHVLTLATALAISLIPQSGSAEVRTWKDASGKFEIRAELVGVQGGRVSLKREDGRVIQISVASLSKEDQALLGGGAATGTAAGGSDWPQWRGPGRDDLSKETGLLKNWPAEGPKRLWVNEDAGLGYGGFAVVGGKIYTLGLFDVDEKVIALDAATGKQLWATQIGTLYKNNWGNGPRSTPAVVGGMVYALGANGDLVCLNAADGKKVWDKSLTKDLGGSVPQWGYTESPLVDGELVLVTPGGPKGAIAALDAKKGTVKWQSKDFTEGAQYSSILPVDLNGKKQYVQLLMKSVVGVEPKDGKVLWKTEFPGQTAVIPTPVHKDGYIYVTAGYGVGSKMVKLAESSAEEVYSNKVIVNHHGGVVLVGEHLYGHSDSGGWTCQEFKTGKEVWKSRDLGKGCVTYADGMLYCVAEDGGTVVLAEASPAGWKEHGRFKLEAQSSQRSPQGRIWTHPVVSGGRLYLRDQEFISCYDVKG